LGIIGPSNEAKIPKKPEDAVWYTSRLQQVITAKGRSTKSTKDACHKGVKYFCKCRRH